MENRKSRQSMFEALHTKIRDEHESRSQIGVMNRINRIWWLAGMCGATVDEAYVYWTEYFV